MIVLLLPFQFKYIYIYFISSSCLLALTRSSNAVLNKSNEKGHPCLFPNLKENASSFCPLTKMLAVISWPIITLRKSTIKEIFLTTWKIQVVSVININFICSPFLLSLMELIQRPRNYFQTVNFLTCLSEKKVHSIIFMLVHSD